ncbi:MAG: MFS transporter [Candidatus Thiodiazotropha sp. (ex Lucina pensylvanica)]|nr:MFS transporter [Candidatus Thiodiazotropha sp. (ex Lucina pensylvanica)]MBT3029867.1 MFS transporter [Candidatus Thiodiazotropha sp. (ex Lucina pensylvanica)]MBT3051659.1 MFS transporter [Candidatus Thiodiazotropha sp. (ex Codakia orbicularis)]
MTSRQRFAYGLLGAPMAMAALPVYIHTPKLYGDELGLGLALTGAILLASRALDTLQDPWLGRLADLMQRQHRGWAVLAGVAASVLVLAYTALFNPPKMLQWQLALWFGVALVLVYTAHSALNITYLAWGANVSHDSHERTRLVAFREGFGLFGVILASLLPMLFSSWFQDVNPWLPYSFVFSLFLLLAIWLLLYRFPLPTKHGLTAQGLFGPLRQSPFRRLATLFLLNGFAVAIAGTLALFYIADVLQLEAYSGLFLATYFISGAVSLPLWLRLSRRLGKSVAWAVGTLVAVVGFVWAVQLGAGDMLPYLLICLLSGAALGADLALPAAIAADIIPQQDRGNTGGYFGIWSLINKGVLALAAGLGLPLLAGFGYQPGGGEGLTALAILYAGVPCLIKLISAGLLMHWRRSLEVQYVF